MKQFVITAQLLMIALTLGTYTAQAQTDDVIVLKLGKNTQPYKIDKTANYEVSGKQLTEDSKINIYSKEGEYVIKEYELAYLGKTNNLVGPFKVSSTNLATSLSDHHMVLSRGARIFVEYIKASCETCTQDKEVTAKGMMVVVQ